MSLLKNRHFSVLFVLAVMVSLGSEILWANWLNPQARLASAVRAMGGEVWVDSSRWLKGDMWDAVMNYIFTRNLWFSFLLHIGWNFFEGPILGFKVSGTTFPSLFQAEPNGDLFITGGDYGLGGSMPMTLFLLVAILVLAWAFERKYQRVTIAIETAAEPSTSPPRA